MSEQENSKPSPISEDDANRIIENQLQLYNQFQDKAFRILQTIIAAIALFGVVNPSQIGNIIQYRDNIEEAANMWFGNPLTILSSLVVSIVFISMALIITFLLFALFLAKIVGVLRNDLLHPVTVSHLQLDSSASLSDCIHHNYDIISTMKEDMSQAYQYLTATIGAISVVLLVGLIVITANAVLLMIVSIILFLISYLMLVYSVTWIVLYFTSFSRPLTAHFVDPLPDILGDLTFHVFYFGIALCFFSWVPVVFLLNDVINMFT